MKKLLFGAVLLAVTPALAQQNVNGYGNFVPDYGQNKAVSATTTSASTSWTGVFIASTDVLVYNSGTTLGFLRCGAGAQTATAADAPIPAGTIQIFQKGNRADTCAVIMSSGTATVYIMSGFGR